MDISITDDNKFLLLKNLNAFELETIQTFFTKKPENSWVIEKKNPYYQTEMNFLNKFGMLPIGLWLELMRYAQIHNVFLNFNPRVNDVIQDNQLQYNIFEYYAQTLFSKALDKDGNPVSPRGYQLEGVFKLLKFKRCCVEVTTSGGKTLMAYMLFKFLWDIKHIKRCLYIVPNKNLATQSWDKFNKYEDWVQGPHNYKPAYLFAGMKKAERKAAENCDVLFATYQTLVNKDDSFFRDFDLVVTDETHHAKNNSIRNILQKCVNAQYVFGVTGTFPKEGSYDRFIIESNIGPLVYTLTAFELINIEHSATPIYVVNTFLDYATDAEKKALYEARTMKDSDDVGSGQKLLKMEQTFVSENYNRLKYICELANKSLVNVLILFNDVKGGNGYGKKMYNYIKENSEKNVFYADGYTPAENRAYFNQQMEEDGDGQTIIVGSYGTYSEGLDVSNIGMIILSEGFKSENTLRQAIGRGMRLGENKDKVLMFDIIDDLRWKNAAKGNEKYKDNYLWKHHLERTKIYNEQRFPVFEQKLGFKVKELF